jgi:hypothetical protein
VEALLPRHAVGVERAAKIKEQRFDWLRHPLRARAPSRPGKPLASIKRV